MLSLRTWALIGISGVATGCAAERTVDVATHLPARFVQQDADSSSKWPGQQWFREFGDAALDELMGGATAGNFDVQAARARVLQADARARQAGAALLPSVDGSAAGTFYAGHSSQGSGHEFDWSAVAAASYELDFWGKNRAAAQSAKLLAGASRAERDTVALTALAGVASGYFQVVALRERLSIAEANRDAAKHLLEVVQSRFEAGAASPVELATQKTTLATAQIALVDLTQALNEATNTVSLLLGKPPEGFELRAGELDAIREPEVIPGLPSELLVRRPDIYFAEAQLRSARADVAAARAAMFPSISLTASAGVANPALPAAVLTIPGVGPTLALGGNLTQPIFDHGKLKAQHDEAVAKESELLVAYRAAIISAFTDVENALAAVNHLNRVSDAQSENLAQSQQAFEGAKARYEAGTGDYLTLLEAQRSLYAARDQFVQYRLARLQARVSLCKALGGGWQSQPDSGERITMDLPQ